MVALHRTAGVTLSGLVASVLPLGARAWQKPVTKTLFANLRRHVDRACVTWTASHQAANLPSVSVPNDVPGGEGGAARACMRGGAR
jgi:hypothetical protein